jgi:hypothetical protein
MKGKIVGGRYYLEGREVSKEEFDAELPDKTLLDGSGETFAGTWRQPILSDALAVHPAQIPGAMLRNARHGLHVEYNQEDGRPILRDRGQRRDLMRIEGAHDNDGGYGDG